jgi:Tol biopolymer transport system component
MEITRLSLRLLLGLAVLLTLLGVGMTAAARVLPGESIIYSEIQGDNGELVIRDLTRDARVIVESSRSTEANATWSPDGRRLAYLSSRSGMFRLYVLSLAPPRGMQIFDSLIVSSGTDMQWAPDSRTLAVEVFNGRAMQIALVDVTLPQMLLVNPRALTATDEDNFLGSWAPDGATLYVSSGRDGSMDIFALDIATGVGHNLTKTPRINEYTPVVSPDGSTVAFYRDPRGDFAVQLVDADGHNLRMLADFASAVSMNVENPPVWSHDGARLAMVAPAPLHFDAYIIALEDGKTTRLNLNALFDDEIVWLAGRDDVIVMSFDGTWALYGIPLDGSAAYRITGTRHDAIYADLWPR